MSAKNDFLKTAAGYKEDKPAAAPDHLAELLKLAEFLSAPAAVQKRTKELTDATTALNAATAYAEKKTASDLVVATQKDLAAQRAAHDARLTAEAAEHERRMKRDTDELAAKIAAVDKERRDLADQQSKLTARAKQLTDAFGA